MRLPWLAAGFALAIAAFARADVTQLPEPVVNALSSIDRVATATELDSVLGGQAQTLAQLQTIVHDANADVGILLRSLHALSQYPQAQVAHDMLVEMVQSRSARTPTPTDVLLLRAAIESLGALRNPNDAPQLVPLLGHASRDVRATVALALRDLGNTSPAIVGTLRQRFGQESSAQVKLAISDALRMLGGV